MLSEVLQEHPGHVRAAAGLRWAWQRLEAQQATRCMDAPIQRPQLQPLAAPTQPHLATRVATAIACAASVLAVAILLSCGGLAPFAPVPVVDAAVWTPEATASPAVEPGTPPAVASPSPEAGPLTPVAGASTSPAAEALTPAAVATATPPPTATPLPSPTVPPKPTATPAFPGKWIEVSLKEQIAIAWEGATPVRRMVVSTGAARTPTVQGTYRIYAKLTKQNMSGPGYSLANVPHVMYFYSGYALHGAYWQTSFGTPTSHGCVNLKLDDAAWLFAWADPQLPKGAQNVYATAQNPGTPVVIHP